MNKVNKTISETAEEPRFPRFPRILFFYLLSFPLPLLTSSTSHVLYYIPTRSKTSKCHP